MQSLTVDKKALRRQLIERRAAIINAGDKSAEIFKRVVSLAEFKNADTVLCYVSVGDEVSTIDIIKEALKNGKRVAVPRCIRDSRSLEFFYINGLDELKTGAYNIPEPDVNASRITSFDGSVCIVPALSVDDSGTRIGYGGGYYDRFLADYTGIRIATCFDECTGIDLPREATDQPMDLLVTEKYIKRFLKI